MHSTNAYDTFITVASDCAVTRAEVPKPGARPTVAWLTWQMIHAHPYRYTSDDVLFAVHAERHEVPDAERPAARAAFFARGQACLRASPLTKRYGWGVHHDADGRVALYAIESAEYAAFAAGERQGADGAPVTLRPAMRSRAAGRA